MAFKGKRMEIFGAFADRRNAEAAKAKHPGAVIRERKIKNRGRRYLVMREVKK